MAKGHVNEVANAFLLLLAEAVSESSCVIASSGLRFKQSKGKMVRSHRTGATGRPRASNTSFLPFSSSSERDGIAGCTGGVGALVVPFLRRERLWE